MMFIHCLASVCAIQVGPDTVDYEWIILNNPILSRYLIFFKKKIIFEHIVSQYFAIFFHHTFLHVSYYIQTQYKDTNICKFTSANVIAKNMLYSPESKNCLKIVILCHKMALKKSRI